MTGLKLNSLTYIRTRQKSYQPSPRHISNVMRSVQKLTRHIIGIKPTNNIKTFPERTLKCNDYTKSYLT